jgi:Mlc titration factor MtfA (ptsG expression regulator)
MITSWLRQHRRRRILSQAFPGLWLSYLDANVRHYQYLSTAEQAALRDHLRIFMAEKYWEGCAGLTLTDEMEVTISAQACLLTLNLPIKYFPNVGSIFVYPAGYQVVERKRGPGGTVTERLTYRLGEAWHFGPVVLSWQDARYGGVNPEDGRNVVLHEFAHKLDINDGRVDGVPDLEGNAAYERWAEVMSAQYERLVWESGKRHATVLDQYGATNAGEFFAVATEAFFEKPRQLREKHEPRYRMLREYYCQDPAARVDAAIRARAGDPAEQTGPHLDAEPSDH